MSSDPLAHEASVLQALIDIRGRQAELQACCERAEASKADVSAGVFARVMADYRDRLDDLDAEAMPLRLEAREAHTALCASYAEVRAANEQAASAREELLFRHKVGEFDSAVLDARIKDPEQRLAACAEAIAALDARRARFLEAFGGEAELEAFMGQPAAPPAPQAPPGPAVAPEPEPEPAPPAEPELPDPPPHVTDGHHLVLLDPVTREIVQPDNLPPIPVEELDGTKLVALDAAGNLVGTLPPPLPLPQSDTSEAGTMILPSAVLVVHLKGENDREYAVSPFTTIGRSDHNSVCIPRRNVSREHAVIQATAGGFSIKDLGSQNGTLVNGDTIKECALRDGDVLVIGDAQIDFRLLVPPRV